MYISHSFIYSSVSGHLGCVPILAIMNNAAINTEVLVSFQVSVLGFFRHVPRCGIAGSYGSPIVILRENLHTVFHSGSRIYIPTNSAQVIPFLHVQE